jgi:folate-dependent phosphoribosylglycinamide formyltransferase PurN
MNNICLITGDHKRHKYFAQSLIETGEVSSWIIEAREEIIPIPPNYLKEDLKNLYIHHFKERDRIENLVFGLGFDKLTIPIHKVTKKNLNDKNSINFVKKFSPKLVISYGCHKISEQFIDNVDACFWNVHGGISPEYRGAITHFWPSYFLEPRMTGMTLHETTNSLDGGKILFQTSAPMISGDTLHRLAARNVEIFTEELKLKFKKLNFSNLPEGKIQSGYGKVFLTKDWRPEHLRLIYEVYNDQIVDNYINGKISGKEPELINVIEKKY